MTDFSVTDTLDTCGLFCPEPVMLLHNKIRDARPGAIIEVIATDPSTRRDIPRFCTFLNHRLLEERESDNKYYYYIQKI